MNCGRTNFILTFTIKYLNDILQSNNIGFIYKEAITKQELSKLKEDYYVFYHSKLENKEYSEQEMNEYLELLEENFYTKGVINWPIIEDKIIIDHVDLIQKSEEKLLQNTRIKNSEFWKMQIICPSTAFILPHKCKYGIWTPYPKKIKFVSSKIMEMDSTEQNRVALYLFNSINFKFKNYKSLDNREQMF